MSGVCVTPGDESAASGRPVFLELIPERNKWCARQCGDRAADTVEYVSLQQRARLSSQMRGLRLARECRDPLDRRALSIGVLRTHPFLLQLVSPVPITASRRREHRGKGQTKKLTTCTPPLVSDVQAPHLGCP